LKESARGNLRIGAAVSAPHVDDPVHAAMIVRQFDVLTAGNEMKPDALQKVKGQFTFERADKIVQFAESHGLKVVGHTLLWHNQTPKWMFEDAEGQPLSRE